jgi:hypothetical protein
MNSENFVDSILSASNSERWFEEGTVATLKPVAPLSQFVVDNEYIFFVHT